MGPIQHCGIKADCTLASEIVPSSISRGAPHQAAREISTSEGRKLNTPILPQLLGSFTCLKVGTRGRLFDFPTEGRHAEDFYIWKIQRFRPGLNPRTREPEASMLTTRPPKPLRQRKGEYSLKVMFQFHFVHHKHHTDNSVTKHETSRWAIGDQELASW
jgi:hypothetical protein